MTPTLLHNDYIRTFSGTKFYPFDPKPESIKSEDIAHALSLKVRWQGHCNHLYSIATHSIRVANVVKLYDKSLYMYGLLHDAAEAYLPDIPSPVKQHLKEWKDVEQRVEDAIFAHYGMNPPNKEQKRLVKRADLVLLKLESQELFSDSQFKDWPTINDIEVTAKEKLAAKWGSHKPEFMSTKLLGILNEYENTIIP